MLFSLLSVPCFATLAVVKREMNSWKAMFALLFGLLILAYVSTFIAFQIGSLLNIGTKVLS